MRIIKIKLRKFDDVKQNEDETIIMIILIRLKMIIAKTMIIIIITMK